MCVGANHFVTGMYYYVCGWRGCKPLCNRNVLLCVRVVWLLNHLQIYYSLLLQCQLFNWTNEPKQNHKFIILHLICHPIAPSTFSKDTQENTVLKSVKKKVDAPTLLWHINRPLQDLSTSSLLPRKVLQRNIMVRKNDTKVFCTTFVCVAKFGLP